MTRRGLVLLGLLASGCSLTSKGGVLTLTVDVAKIGKIGAPIVALLEALLATPAIAGLLGPNLIVAQAALSAVVASWTQLEQLTGGSATLTIDTTQATSLVLALANNAATLIDLVLPIVPNLPEAARMTVANRAAAGLTLLPILRAAVGLSAPAPSVPPMSEDQALAVAAQAQTPAAGP